MLDGYIEGDTIDYDAIIQKDCEGSNLKDREDEYGISYQGLAEYTCETKISPITKRVYQVIFTRE